MLRFAWGKRVLAATAVLAVFAGWTIAPRSSAYLHTVTGNAIIVPPPSSVTVTGAGDPTRLLVFDELQGITLAAPLKVDFVAPGLYTATGRAQYVPAGTIVDSHYVQSNRKGAGTSIREATLTFAQDIVGVIATRSKLDDSDGLGAVGTTYGGAYPNRELEFGAGDWVRIVDARTLIVHVDSSTVVDQVRVITKHNAPPVPAPGGPYAGLEGDAIGLVGTAPDPDGDPVQYQWSFSTTGDPGVTCTTTGVTTLTPSVSCTDDAVVTATLAAKDAYHPWVSGPPTTVTVGNATPTASTPTLPSGQVPIASVVMLAATFADVGTNDTHTASVDWGDATSGPAVVAPGPQTITASHTYATPGVYTVQLTVHDDNGGSVTTTGTVAVNGPPTAAANGPYSGAEGAPVGLSATTIDGEGDPLTPSWVFTPLASDPGTTCNATGTGSASPTIECTDDVVVDAELTVTDGINPPVVANTTVTITNAPPLVGGLSVSGTPIVAGELVTLGGTFSDPSTNDTHTATVDWGDATVEPLTPTEASGSGSVAGSHAWATPGSYSVTVTVTDDDGGSDAETLTVVVNAPPTADAGGPYAGAEGSPNVLVGTAGDVDGDALSVAWTFTWTGSASCSSTGATTLTPTLTCDDDTVVTAELIVADGINPAVTSTTTLSVGNESPTAGGVHVTPLIIHAFQSATASVVFADAGTGDTHTATIDWGDGNTTVGTVTEASGTGTVSGSHPYSAAGTYTVTVTITDDDGGSVTVSSVTGVLVNDPPTAEAGGPYSGIEGSALSLAGSATDPEGDPITYSWSFSWSGTGVTCVTTGDTTATPTVACDDDTLVTAVLIAADGHSSSVGAVAVVSIGNADPTLGTVATDIALAPVGDSVTVSASFADAGAHDTHSAIVSWDDGASTVAMLSESAGSGTVTDSHSYGTPGIYTVTVTVTDDDGGSVTGSTDHYVVVFDPAFGRIETLAHGYLSPSGAYTPQNSGDADITGQAFLGMNVAYASPMSTVPTGTAKLRFHLPTLHFDSTTVDWLVVDPALTDAWFAGTGLVNGVPGYDFLAVAADGHPSPDFVRIRIVEHATGVVVYDTQFGAADDATATTPSNQGALRILP
jgi:PKD repeat protein